MNNGGWEYDSHGKKFRRIGNVVEYACEVTTAGSGTVYLDELQDTNNRIQKEHERRRQEANARAKMEPKGNCPFKIANNSMKPRCALDCAFCEDSACILSRTGTKPTKDTKGMPCPIIARQCLETCALYKDGCTLIDFVKGMKPGKE